MRAFAALLDRLILSPQRNTKLRLIEDHLRAVPDPERGWALAAITGELDFPAAKPAMLRELIAARTDPVLFALSYDYVGDLAETISLLWPAPAAAAPAPPTLSAVVEGLGASTRAAAPDLLAAWLDGLDVDGRWALLKLVTGGLRVGVSGRLAKQALASFGQVPIEEIEGLWHGLEPPYADLFAWLEGRGEKPEARARAPFRPVMLAHPLIPKSARDDPDAVDPDLVQPDVFAAEWKWDGVRVQAVCDRGVRRLYTRTGEDISETFPDVLAAMTFSGALDGELLVRRSDGSVAPFSDLQQRLNRKVVTKRHTAAHPAFVRAYDLLVDGDDDLRASTFRERRARLEAFLAEAELERFDLSPLVAFSDFASLRATRDRPPVAEVEGLMLKRWDAPYLVGRPKGLWWKWKRDPHLVDAVLMYAQRGHGKRSSFYSDFTFGLWREGADGLELAPIGKAYFGFTDEELKRLDAFVRNNTGERFGPVRQVRAGVDFGLVLEIAFEGINRSPRHKSGVALRFPRINRIRWDKPAAEADRLATLEAMLPPG